MDKKERKLVIALLKQTYDLLERANCALLPDMEDVPTARAETQMAQELVSLFIDHFDPGF